MVEHDGRHAPPGACGDANDHPAAKRYRAPTLTVYGSVRDLTLGAGIGPPDNGVSQSHSMSSPWGKKSK